MDNESGGCFRTRSRREDAELIRIRDVKRRRNHSERTAEDGYARETKRGRPKTRWKDACQHEQAMIARGDDMKNGWEGVCRRMKISHTGESR